MNLDCASIFTDSAKAVFEKEIHVQLETRDIHDKNSLLPTMPKAVMIYLTGPVHGQVVFSMDENFAYSTAKLMLAEKTSESVYCMVNDVICELANMITGIASISLAGNDGIINMTPPVIYSGANKDFPAPAMSISLNSSIGTLEINIALQDIRGG